MTWDIQKEHYKLQKETYFQCLQLISAIPRSWKDNTKKIQRTLITSLLIIII